ncbi:MAG: DUF975 family protein [Leadbetterella sp.]|jgi:uncharacterized membrane protein|nr:DUF975 family protein [Leadbetterella sp.]
MSIVDLFREANGKLNGKHLLAIGTVLIYFLIAGIPSGFDERYGILSLLISAPLSLGISSFFLNLVRGNEVRVEQMFDGFKNYVPSLIMTILITLAVGFGLVLLIVPGIIIGIGFSMSYFILADNPQMDAVSAMKASWEMMKGNKADYFVFSLLSILLCILGLIVLVVGFFYVVPIIYAASALFYEKIRLKA